jgi:hypothetical protein
MAAKDAEIDEKAILINKLRSQISSVRHSSSKRDSSGCKCAYQCDKPLCGISIDFKIDSGSVPDYIRDLAVDLLCFRLEPAYKVFPIICDVLRTFGATIVHDVTSCTILTLFLVERDIMLFDDMMMRVASSMAKRSLSASAPLPEEALLEQSYTQSVEQHPVLKFLTDPNYKANKLPAPEAIEVGPLARVYETDDIPGDEIEEQEAERNFQLDRKGCACHYYSIDGTNHQRNDREEVAHVIGGFEGAPPAGEFLDYTEMFSGSAPQKELLCVVHKLKMRCRRAMRRLGVQSRHRIYLYDFPAWGVDNTGGNGGTGLGSAQNGLLAMIELWRRAEYNWLKCNNVREMGRFVPLMAMSCQHHDSNLVNVLFSTRKRHLEASVRYPFAPHRNPACAEADIKGNKQTECKSYNFTRFMAGCVKKNANFRAFMGHNYGDYGGIPVVKSARFWSVLITGAEYFLVRASYVWQFHQRTKAVFKRTQIGETLAYGYQSKELIEFDWVLMAVDYYGFHKPWNKRVADLSRTPDQQALSAKETVEYHQRCVDNISQGNAHWIKFARIGKVRTLLFIWKSEQFAGSSHGPCSARCKASVENPAGICICVKKAPLKAAVDAKRAELEATVTVDLPPRECNKFVHLMHQCVVDKLTQMLPTLVETGRVSKAIRESKGPSTNIGPGGVEGAFKDVRHMYDKCSTALIERQAAIRRVRMSKQNISLQNPPAFYTDTLRAQLRGEARHEVNHEWTKRADAVAERWAHLMTKEHVAAVAADKQAGRVDKWERAAREMPGGLIGAADARERLPPLIRLTPELLRTVNFGENSRSSKWGLEEIGNQLKLRNLPEYKAKMLEELAVFATWAEDWYHGALKTGGDRDVMIARLEKVVREEAELERRRTEKAAAHEAAAPGRGKRQKRSQGHRHADTE